MFQMYTNANVEKFSLFCLFGRWINQEKCLTVIQVYKTVVRVDFFCLHGTTRKPSLVCLSLSKKIWSGIIFCLWSFQTWLHQHVVLLLLAKANKLLNRQFLEWFQQQPVLIIMLSVQCDAVDACQRVKLYVLHLHWALVLVSWISVLAILGWGTWPAVVSDQYWYWGWPAQLRVSPGLGPASDITQSYIASKMENAKWQKMKFLLHQRSDAMLKRFLEF